jgi:predicted ferric reductase/mono/diheme cytochrome c family protein
VQLQATRGPLVLAALSAAPVVIWAGSTPLDERFTGSFAALTSVAVACALAGTSAFALNLVLGARLRLVAALFGGLEPMYRAHRATGRLAFALLLAHVVLILAARATVSTDAALSLLGPGAGWTVFAGVLAFGAMTVAIALTLFVRLGHEVFVYVQRSFGFAFLGATYHVFTTSGAKADSRLLNAYLATLATLGLAAFAYRSLLGSVLVRRRRYRVEAVDRLDESVTEIVMRPVGRTLAFAPGQFVFVNFRSLALRERFRPFELSAQGVLSIRTGEVSNQFHPFSITSAPGEPALRITVKAVGDYTRALRELEAGAEAIVEGPYGSFSHRDVPERRQIWIAGGIGVTPFLSMARSLGDRDEPSVDFYYCVERREEAHFLDELHEIAGRRPDFRVTLVPRDTAGFLTAERIAAETGDLSSRAALICGPPAMIESLRGQLLARGMHRTRIHAEEFGFARLGRSVDAGADVPPPATSSRLRPRRRPPDVAAAVFTLVALAFAGFTFAIGIVVGSQASSQAAAADGTGPARTATGAAPPTADGRDVFASAGCGECHTLAAAGSTGSVGPNLDEANPEAERVREVVANGSGAMPAYRSRLDDRQIDAVAAFLSRAAAR